MDAWENVYKVHLLIYSDVDGMSLLRTTQQNNPRIAAHYVPINNLIISSCVHEMPSEFLRFDDRL